MTGLRRTTLTNEERSRLTFTLAGTFSVSLESAKAIVTVILEELPELNLGRLAEIGEIVTAPKSTIHQWAGDMHVTTGFPDPAVVCSDVRLWDLDMVRQWYRTFQPPGRGFRSDLRRR